MLTEIKAIETVYNGYRFRSRLEARWAVFFSSLGIVYEYEREGFELAYKPVLDCEDREVPNAFAGITLRYLPDFWLPDQACWVEIKGEEPSAMEIEKCGRLSRSTNRDVFLFFGAIPMPEDDANMTTNANHFSGSAYAFTPDGGYDTPYHWCQCLQCGRFGIEFDGRSDRLKCKECYWCAEYRKYQRPACHIHGTAHSGGCLRTGANLDKGYMLGSPDLVSAYAAARQARFGR